MPSWWLLTPKLAKLVEALATTAGPTAQQSQIRLEVRLEAAKFRHDRFGSCVTSVASPNGYAQLYER